MRVMVGEEMYCCCWDWPCNNCGLLYVDGVRVKTRDGPRLPQEMATPTRAFCLGRRGYYFFYSAAFWCCHRLFLRHTRGTSCRTGMAPFARPARPCFACGRCVNVLVLFSCPQISPALASTTHKSTTFLSKKRSTDHESTVTLLQ